MSNYANNMPPYATAGAYSPNAEAATNAWANNAAPMYTSPAAYGPPMGHGPMHCGPKPVYAAAVACGSGSTGTILVLFILLVIISRTFL